MGYSVSVLQSPPSFTHETGKVKRNDNFTIEEFKEKFFQNPQNTSLKPQEEIVYHANPRLNETIKNINKLIDTLKTKKNLTLEERRTLIEAQAVRSDISSSEGGDRNYTLNDRKIKQYKKELDAIQRAGNYQAIAQSLVEINKNALAALNDNWENHTGFIGGTLSRGKYKKTKVDLENKIATFDKFNKKVQNGELTPEQAIKEFKKTYKNIFGSDFADSILDKIQEIKERDIRAGLRQELLALIDKSTPEEKRNIESVIEELNKLDGNKTRKELKKESKELEQQLTDNLLKAGMSEDLVNEFIETKRNRANFAGQVAAALAVVGVSVLTMGAGTAPSLAATTAIGIGAGAATGFGVAALDNITKKEKEEGEWYNAALQGCYGGLQGAVILPAGLAGKATTELCKMAGLGGYITTIASSTIAGGVNGGTYGSIVAGIDTKYNNPNATVEDIISSATSGGLKKMAWRMFTGSALGKFKAANQLKNIA